MIHQYKLNGYNIIIDTASGAVHSVDDVAYDAISMFETCTREEITVSLLEKYSDEPDVTAEEIGDLLDDIQYLKDEKKLFTKDIYEGQSFNLKQRNPVVKALCLHVSHACNLNCEYCFASQGKYHGQSALMSFEVGKQALDFLIANSGTRTNLEVDFFGGEPLLNFEVVKQLVEYARSVEKEHGKNFRFTLTTNGVLIDDDVIDFCNRERNTRRQASDSRRQRFL